MLEGLFFSFLSYKVMFLGEQYLKREFWITGVAIAWVIFQLLLPQFLILDSSLIRAVHLGFALVLTFLLTGFLPGRKNLFPKFAGLTQGLGVLLLLFIFYAALYRVLNWEEIVLRIGLPTILDLLMGGVLLLILLEAVRRKVGLTLAVVALLFTAYAFFASSMPDFLAFKSVSLTKYLNQIVLSDEGIFGIPLGVSASTVFLFVFLGALLNQAGAGQFFTQGALAVLGRFRGGPAKAAVLASTCLGSFSGSSVANVVTSGNFTIPLMQKTGYPSQKAAAIEVAASTDGQIMPPIMGAAAFIIAEYINAPYIEVVKAALIPALASSVALFYITHLEACKLKLKPLAAKEVPVFWPIFKSGLHYLLVIFFLLYELFVLQHTPEFAAYVAILVLLTILFFQGLAQHYRNFRAEHLLGVGLRCKNLLSGILGILGGAFAQVGRIFQKGCLQGAQNMVPVALATAAAGIIVGVVTMGPGGLITQIVEFLAQGNFYLLLLIMAIACLILGIGLPTTATYIVMASLLATVIVDLGAAYNVFVPLIAAHLFCFYFGILADDTPPVGLAAYAAAAIAKSDPIKTGLQSFAYDVRTAILPFFFVLNTDLLLYEIQSFWLGVLIFSMAILGILFFESAVQNWFLVRNKWYEIPFFLGGAFLCLGPGLVADLLNISAEQKYYFYVLGVCLGLGLFFWQKRRVGC